MFSLAGQPLDRWAAALSRPDRTRLVQLLKHLKIGVTGTLAFANGILSHFRGYKRSLGQGEVQRSLAVNVVLYFVSGTERRKEIVMASVKPRGLVEAHYEAAAQEYLRSLPLEHFMEAKGQSTQREITLESLALVKPRRPDMQVFNEMLVQYPVPGQRRPGQVVPDNMVVLSEQPAQAESSFNLPLESAKPFWVLEYVSNSNKRKDYEDNFDKYEKDLKVPYYLTFYPDDQELTLYRHTGKKYVSVKPNKHGRYAIKELGLEVGLLDHWVRFWLEGQLLPLPAELQRELERARQRADEERRRTDEEKRRADELQRQLEEAEAELARLRAGGKLPGRRNNGRTP